MPAPDLAALLAALPVGRTMWVEVRGRSMWPVLLPGDRLHVQRCDSNELVRGDVAVLSRADGLLVSHLVRDVNPVRTVSFLGREDEGLAPLAKALSARRGRLTVPLVAPVLTAAQRAFELAARSPLFSAWRMAVEIASSPITAPVRSRLLGEVKVATFDSLHTLALALSYWESPRPEALEDVFARGAAAGAWARGRLVGVCIEDRCYVREPWTGLGLEGRLLTLSRSRSSRRAG